jgi:hypothetical protein
VTGLETTAGGTARNSQVGTNRALNIETPSKSNGRFLLLAPHFYWLLCFIGLYIEKVLNLRMNWLSSSLLVEFDICNEIMGGPECWADPARNGT